MTTPQDRCAYPNCPGVGRPNVHEGHTHRFGEFCGTSACHARVDPVIESVRKEVRERNKTVGEPNEINVVTAYAPFSDVEVEEWRGIAPVVDTANGTVVRRMMATIAERDERLKEIGEIAERAAVQTVTALTRRLQRIRQIATKGQTDEERVEPTDVHADGCRDAACRGCEEIDPTVEQQPEQKCGYTDVEGVCGRPEKNVVHMCNDYCKLTQPHHRQACHPFVSTSVPPKTETPTELPPTDARVNEYIRTSERDALAKDVLLAAISHPGTTLGAEPATIRATCRVIIAWADAFLSVKDEMSNKGER